MITKQTNIFFPTNPNNYLKNFQVGKKETGSTLTCWEKDKHHCKWKPADCKASNDHHDHRSYPAL